MSAAIVLVPPPATKALYYPPECFRLQGVAQGIKLAYEAWRVHWLECPICHQQDWNEPGAPLIRTDLSLKERRMYADRKRFTIPTRKGEQPKPYWVFNRADYSTLCLKGQGLHRSWVKEAALHEFPN